MAFYLTSFIFARIISFLLPRKLLFPMTRTRKTVTCFTSALTCPYQQYTAELCWKPLHFLKLLYKKFIFFSIYCWHICKIINGVHPPNVPKEKRIHTETFTSDKPNQIITGTRPTVGQLRSLQEDPVHILEMYLGLSLNK